MKSQKNELATLSPSQRNCYTASPEDFPITHADSSEHVPFHGQCGKDEQEYAKLLKQTDARGKSKFGAPRLPATEASSAKPPRTSGMNQAEG